VTVAPTFSTPIVLKFRPIAEGIRSASVTVKSNARDVSKEVRGEGTAPVLELTPAKVEFPGVLVGSYSKTEVVTIKNRGTGLLQVKSIALPTTAVGSFELQHAELPYTLGSQDTLPVSVTFLPTVEKSSLDVQLTVSAVESRVAPVSMRLVGKGVVEPISEVRGWNLDFGRQLVNHRTYRSLQMKNETADPVTFISATVDTAPGCSQFKGDALPSGGITLEPFATKEYSVAFTPQSEGLPSNCIMRLGFGQLKDKINVTLSGQGIPTLLSISKTLIDFKSVRAGGPKLTDQFTITNLSSDNVLLSAPETTFSTGAPFTLKYSLPNNILEPNVPLPITVEYEPQVATSSVTKLAFSTMEPQQLRVVSLELKGEATLRILDVDPTTPLDWQRVELNGVPQVKTVTVTNSSTQAQKLRLAIKNGSGSPFSADVNGSVNNIDIPAQGSIKLNVTFLPAKVGGVEDEVQVMLQDVATPEVTVSVKGVGQILTGRGGAEGCSCGSTGMGSTGLLAMLTLLGLRSRRRRQE
jgi:MYXO-CTERM domain-containing protein